MFCVSTFFGWAKAAVKRFVVAMRKLCKALGGWWESGAGQCELLTLLSWDGDGVVAPHLPCWGLGHLVEEDGDKQTLGNHTHQPRSVDVDEHFPGLLLARTGRGLCPVVFTVLSDSDSGSLSPPHHHHHCWPPPPQSTFQSTCLVLISGPTISPQKTFPFNLEQYNETLKRPCYYQRQSYRKLDKSNVQQYWRHHYYPC